MAAGRAQRPGVGVPQIEPATQEELDSCPFCGGREDRTPPETLRIGDPWLARAVPNLYPAFERQEVVIHGRAHARSFADLPEEVVAAVAAAWQLRRHGEPHGYLHALVNEGRAAGASLAHTHSQLVWLADQPPAALAERKPPCGVCAVLATGSAVAERDGLVLVAPHAARVPYELLIAPRDHVGNAFTSDLLGGALQLLTEAIQRLRGVEGPVPWNAWLHEGAHWHIEVLPRLTVFAGIELGAGIYVNTLAPEEAAARLRDAGR